ncbi:helix-turn-helix domain-containing protein [Pseudomonas aeruginosa]|nr:helix-turn-helix domain-containing protein [Pseudomonas aeruginosa]
MANRAYKYRFYPTSEQAQLLAQTFGCTRFVYNYVLRWLRISEHRDRPFR